MSVVTRSRLRLLARLASCSSLLRTYESHQVTYQRLQANCVADADANANARHEQDWWASRTYIMRGSDEAWRRRTNPHEARQSLTKLLAVVTGQISILIILAVSNSSTHIAC